MDTFTAFVIFFLCFWFVAFLVLIILRFTRESTTTQELHPTLQEVFESMSDQGDSIDLQKNPGKPFQILSDQKQQSTFDTYTFDNSSSSIAFPAARYIGFRFRTTSGPIYITALQFISMLSPTNNSHIVAIYNLQSGIELTSTTDRIVNRTTDVIDANGFVTHFLTSPILIPANTPIAIVIQVDNNDRYLQNPVQVESAILVEGGIATTNATLTLPTVFTPGVVQYLVGFQFRLPEVAGTAVFDVSLVNGGFGRFPPKYVRNLTVSVPNDGSNVIIDKGFCISQNNEANIQVSLPLALTSANGVNGLDTGDLVGGTWYNVFVISSSMDANVASAGLLSLGRLEPTVLPNGFDIFRRVGTVLATSDTTFDPLVQEGDANSRQASFTGSVFAHLVTSSPGETVGYISTGPINYVPPTATQCTIAVRGTMVGTGPPPVTPINGLVRFRPRFALEEGVWTLGFPNEPSTFGEIVVTLAPIPVPHEVEFRVFPKLGTGGAIPSDPTFFFNTQYYITSYFETI